MKHVTNCKNCGAALNVWKPHCEFCGTKNVNLTALDLASGEPANFIFKMPNNIKVLDRTGQEIYMTLLAVPSLEMVTIQPETVSMYSDYGQAPLLAYAARTEMQMDLKLTTVTQGNTPACELRVGDNKC